MNFYLSWQELNIFLSISLFQNYASRCQLLKYFNCVLLLFPQRVNAIGPDFNSYIVAIILQSQFNLTTEIKALSEAKNNKIVTFIYARTGRIQIWKIHNIQFQKNKGIEVFVSKLSCFSFIVRDNKGVSCFRILESLFGVERAFVL